MLFPLSQPAFAWEFHPGLPCRLTHDAPAGAVELTFDPTRPLYTISLTRADGWRAGDVFSIEFTGPAGLVISTNRHELSADGRTLTVTDTGFGNVLNGLQFNQNARARLGTQVFDIPLSGAADPVDRFRRCTPVAGV